MDTQINALKLLLALKDEWEREPSLLKCRHMVALSPGLTQSEYNRAVHFLVRNGLINAATKDGKKVAQPSNKGFAFLESEKTKPNSIPRIIQTPSEHQRGGNDAPSKRANKDDKRKRFFRDEDKLVSILEIAGGVVFFALGCEFTEAGVHIGAYVCYFLAVTCGIGAGYQKTKSSLPYSGIIFSILILSNIFLFYYLSRRTDHADIAPPAPTLAEELIHSSRETIARQWEPPKLTNGTDHFEILLGGNVSEQYPLPASLPKHGKITYPGVMTFGAGPLAIPYVTNDKVYVQAQCPFGAAESTVTMNDEWPSKIPSGWDKNYTSNKFEVVNEKNNVVFQICYDTPAKIRVYGIFVGTNGYITAAFNGVYMGGIGILPPIPVTKPWFKYPSSQYLGELSE